VWKPNQRDKDVEAIPLSDIRGRLRKADRASSFFPLATLLQKFHALVTLQNAALGSDVAGFFEAGVL
jgi:hypothetical protein